ncbi:hypothetical protein Scep_005455 [Stephania cephalantha]|uniref:Nucleotidyl transferase domain-containing protein n=1 Tax=Stephania cephalantha TaxID=152367 RepID=A0AAP0KUL4_9MAGN
MARFLKDYESKIGIKITCSQETKPLGTAGPLALAKDKLIDESGSPFFVLNSDVICEFRLEKMIEFHKAHGGEASIMVTKPKTFVGNKINAGIYLLNPSLLDRIELRPTSIYREVFPKIAADRKLKGSSKPSSGSHIRGNVLIDETAVVEGGWVFGPDVAIGPECVVEEGVDALALHCNARGSHKQTCLHI